MPTHAHPSGEETDSALLARYGRRGDEAAFEALARRHVDMIFATALRKSGDRQLAEEATQNVLLAMSAKARKLALQERNLMGWLHKSSRFEVAKLQRREARIRKREQAYANATMNDETDPGESEFRQLYPMLDQAIDQLRDPDREVIVRRYFKEQSFRSIADALGISEDAAQKRTSRAFDQLNHFFKRKAGVTISAAALAAGISQHCVEAAPASCLKIPGGIAAAGAASGITTTLITTMSTTKTAAIAAGVAILGGAVAFFASQDDSSPGAVAPRPVETASLPPGSKREPATTPTGASERAGSADEVITAGDAADYSPNRELARLEARNPHPGKDEFARRLAVKQDQLLEDLTDDLGLDTAQVASARQVLDARLKAFRAALESGPQPGDPEQESIRKEAEMIVRAGGIIRGAGLREDLGSILSAEQLAAFDEREAEAWQAGVESHAYTELSKLAPVLELTGEQKDRVFELLQTASEEILRTDASERAYFAMQKGQAAAQMDLPDPVETGFFLEITDGRNPMATDSPEFRKRLLEVVGGRIEERVGLLAPVLDERQTQRYRDHLTRQSLLSLLSAEPPSSE